MKKTFIEWLKYLEERNNWGGCNVYPSHLTEELKRKQNGYGARTKERSNTKAIA